MHQIDELKNADGKISKKDIMKVIPYNEHFLFLDEITEIDKKNLTATLQVTGKEPFIQGHFVDFPIFPGALLVEAVGQAGTFLMRYNMEDHQSKDVLAYKVKKAVFKYPVIPGDTVTFKVKLKGMNKKGGVVKGEVIKNDRVCGEAKFVLAIVDRQPFREKFLEKMKGAL